MKKMMAILMALTLVFAAAAAVAEEKTFTFRDGVTFGMNLDQVTAAETGRYEIETEHTHGPVTFTELEYEHVTVDNKPADLKYLFLGNELVAIRIDFKEGAVTYDQAKSELTALHGEATTVDLTKLGKGIYAADDDGRLEAKAEAIVSGNVMIIIEEDKDEVDVTFVDLSAAYINN